MASRRFGCSLGVDLSPTDKSCNFDCLYCELKAAKVTDKIVNYPDIKDIISQLKVALEKYANIDVITITANGEPSLYPYLSELITEINRLKTTQKSLILSNGTAVLDEHKFKALLGLDIVKFSLDSAVQKTFRKIDRGLKNYDVTKMILKMSEFSREFKGELVMETLVLDGFNDTLSEFVALNEAFAKIAPHRVDISSLDRPPAHDVKGISEERLSELANVITSAPVVLVRKNCAISKQDYDIPELRKLLKLRPQSKFDVENNFSEFSRANLRELLDKKIVRKVDLAGVSFFRI